MKKKSPSSKCSAESEAFDLDSGKQETLNAFGPTTTINTLAKSIGKDLVQKNSSKATSKTSEQTLYLSTSYLQRGFHVRVFPLRENAEDFKTKQGELFSTKYAELLEVKDLATYSLRMLKDYFHTPRAVPSRSYSFHWMSLGIMSTGKCLTLNIGCPRTASGSLSSVLEDEVSKKYYLSKAMIEYIKKKMHHKVPLSDVDKELKSPIRGQGDKPIILHNIYGGFKERKPRVFIEASPTIRTPKGGGHLPGVFKGNCIRRLTPRECERLQGFPDDWTKVPAIGNNAGIAVASHPEDEDEIIRGRVMSDTQRYKAMGNAVSVPVVEAIGRKILEYVN